MIEFQKKGLPHTHILILAKKEDNIISENIDTAVHAEIPLEEDNSVLFKLIIKHMVYKNSQTVSNAICHDKASLCTKRFP